MSVPIPGKSSWPELVGVNATLAATAIAPGQAGRGRGGAPAGGACHPGLQPLARPRLHRQQQPCRQGPRHRLGF